MLRVDRSAQFKKDWKRVARSGRFDQSRFEHVANMLANDLPLEPKYRDHALGSEWEGCRECHVCPDLLLIYLKDAISVTFVRIGSHSELFG